MVAVVDDLAQARVPVGPAAASGFRRGLEQDHLPTCCRETFRGDQAGKTGTDHEGTSAHATRAIAASP